MTTYIETQIIAQWVGVFVLKYLNPSYIATRIVTQ